MISYFSQSVRTFTKRIVYAGLVVMVMCGGLWLSISTAIAQTNPQINYQGKLTNPSGLAVPDGEYNMRFYLYNTTGGATTSAIWTETLTGANAVTVENGLFSIMLGSTTPLTIDFNQTLYLGVEIGATGTPAWDGEMTPRKILGTVPAAFVAQTAGQADNAALLGGVASTSFLRSDIADSMDAFLTLTSGASTSDLIVSGTATTTNLVVGTDFISSLTGAGLTITGNALTVATTSLGLGNGTLSGLTDVTVTTPTTGQLLSYSSGQWINFATSSLGLGNGTFLGLSDTPGSYSANQIPYMTGSALTTSGNLSFNGDLLTATGGINVSSLTSTSTFNGKVIVSDGAIYDGPSGSPFVYAKFPPFGGNGNTLLGSNALNRIYDSSSSFNSANTMIGSVAGSELLLGNHNVALGAFSFNIATGSENVALGYNSLGNMGGDPVEVHRTVAIGPYAGGFLEASNNILIGYRAADSLTTGANNIVIGYDVEAPSNTASNQLNIGNLIFGTGIDGTGTTLSSGNVGIGTTTPSSKLTVAGNTYLGGNLRLTGAFLDSTNATGTSGMILASTGTSTMWVSTTSLGFLSDISGSNLGDLGDVNVAGATVGALLQYTGSGWATTSTSSLGIALADTTGTLPVNRGGTGVTTFGGANTILYTTAADTLASSSTFLFDGTNLALGTTTLASQLNLARSGITAAGTAGITQTLEFANTVEDAVQIGNQSRFYLSPTATTALAANLIRVYDTSTYGNIVRGLEVQADQGSNINGENTAISAFARTFAVRGTTRGTAGVLFEPAGVIGETQGTTQGNALRGFSNTIQTANLMQLLQTDSVFSGTALMVDMAKDSGTFTGNFLDLRNNNATQFFVTATGTTYIGGNLGIGTITPSSKLTVAGDAFITGALRDSANASGTSGMILSSTGTSTMWVSTTSLGFLSDISASSLGDLGDVDTTGALTGNLLSFTGSGWATTSTSSLAIALADTTGILTATRGGTGLSSITPNQLLIGGAGDTWTQVATSSLGLTFLGLSDTPGSYTANRIPYMTGSALTTNGNFTFDGTNLNVGGILTVGDGSSSTPSLNFNTDPTTGFYFDDVTDRIGLSYNGDTVFESGVFSSSLASTRFSGGINVDGVVLRGVGVNGLYIGSDPDTLASPGTNTIMIGNQAGRLSASNESIIIGPNAGFYLQGDFNTLIGTEAGALSGALGSVTGNTMVGSRAGVLSQGSFNAFLGERAGFLLNSTSSVAIGAEALRGSGSENPEDFELFTALNNVAIGYRAGRNATTSADNNILLGYQAADNLTTGANNIVIGYDVDLQSSSQSNTLNIGNLIFGTGINGTGTTLSSGNIGIGSTTPSSKLTVAGNTFIGGNLRATGTVQFDALTSGLLRADASGVLSSIATSSLGLGNGTFLGLSDTPGSYSTNHIPYMTGSALTTSGDFVYNGSRLNIGGVPAANFEGSRLTVREGSPTIGIEGDKLVKFMRRTTGTAGTVNDRTLSAFLQVDPSGTVAAGRSMYAVSGNTVIFSNSNNFNNRIYGTSGVVSFLGSGTAEYLGGVLATVGVNNASTNVLTVVGSTNEVSMFAGAATTTIGTLSSIAMTGGTIFNAIGTYNQVTVSGAGSITNAYGTYVDQMSASGGSVTNAFGLYIAPQDVGSQNYGVYVDGVTANYFGGNLGIGSTTPSSKLTVAGDTYIGGNLRATGTVQFDALTSGLLLANGSGVLSSVATSSLGIALADTTGTLTATRGGTGLSSITPNQLLIGGAGDTWTQIATSSLGLSATFSNSAQLAALLSDETGTGFSVFSDSPVFTTQITAPLLTNAGTLALSATGANIITASTNGSERLRIDSAGNVGIGTSSPSSKLDVWGSFRVGTSSVPLALFDTAANTATFGTAASGTASRRTLMTMNNVTQEFIPSDPYIIGGVSSSTALNEAFSVAVAGRYAYVTANLDNSLRIIDVSNPTAPVIVGGVKEDSFLNRPRAVAVAGRYAYVANNTDNSLRIIDVSNPTAPTIVGGIKDDSLLNGLTSVTVAGRYAYVVGFDNSLRIIDVSNPTAPTIVGGVKDNSLLNGAYSVAVAGRYAYVATNVDNSLRIIDVSNPATPAIVGGVKDNSLLEGANSVAVAGRYAYVVNSADRSLRIIDVSEPTAPVIIGGVKDASLLNLPFFVTVAGRYAYVANSTDNSLRIIDLGGIDTPTGNIGSLFATTLDTDRLQVNQWLSVSGGASIASDALIGGALTITGTASSSLFSNNTNPALIVGSGNVGIGTTTPSAKLTIDRRNFTGAGTFGIEQYLLSSNSTLDAVQFGNQLFVQASNTATTTLVGSLIRVADSTGLGNVVRALEVQADRGNNTQGENTAISGFARTFGVRGTTRGDAGGEFEPAGGFFSTEGTTQGNAIRGYSNTITTASLLSLFQDTSVFAGVGLLMNFGNGTGTFSSTTASRFIDAQVGGTSKFVVSNTGTLTIGDGTTAANLVISRGSICVDEDGECVASTTAGTISAVDYYTGNSDLAEMYFSSDALTPGTVVYLKGGLSIALANTDTADRVLGVVSTKPGITLGADDSSLVAGETGYPLALVGRVPVQVSTENGPISAGDSLMLSSLPGIAMKATGTGFIIGTALDDFAGTAAYSATYINQFGDDIRPPVPPITLTDPRIHDGCYYSGGRVTGEESCVPLQGENTEAQLAHAQRLADYAAAQAALAALAAKPASTQALSASSSVQVGQVVMFVERRYQYLDSATIATLTNLMQSTSTVTLSSGGVTEVSQSLFARMSELASRFFDGVLTLVGIKAEKVETSELCIGSTCVNEAQLIELLNAQSAPAPSAAPSSYVSAPGEVSEPNVPESMVEADDEIGEEANGGELADEVDVGADDAATSTVGTETDATNEGASAVENTEVASNAVPEAAAPPDDEPVPPVAQQPEPNVEATSGQNTINASDQ